ncbi:hypothetical protein TSAR_000887 [Trichomalopsis sarcophagae]|uniref:Uncharacterized protein n=1 Tax=Trichomalopsis sarcophagae TaxID=543379 RepID=A0A232FDE9_9HYME|nr:hypothetical protein TSAR_000887 [Trichomalopsis sarcophagae]
MIMRSRQNHYSYETAVALLLALGIVLARLDFSFAQVAWISYRVKHVLSQVTF